MGSLRYGRLAEVLFSLCLVKREIHSAPNDNRTEPALPRKALKKIATVGNNSTGNTGRSLSIPCFETRVGYPRSKVPFFFPTLRDRARSQRLCPRGEISVGKH